MHRMVDLACYIRQQHAFFRHEWPHTLLHIFVTSTWRWAIRTFETLYGNFQPTWQMIPYKCVCSIHGVASPRKASWNMSLKRDFMGILCSLKSAISLHYNCRTHSAQTFKFQLKATFVTAILATPIHSCILSGYCSTPPVPKLFARTSYRPLQDFDVDNPTVPIVPSSLRTDKVKS